MGIYDVLLMEVDCAEPQVATANTASSGSTVVLQAA